MQLAYSETKVKRKPTNVSVRVDLLQIAREDNINPKNGGWLCSAGCR